MNTRTVGLMIVAALPAALRAEVIHYQTPYSINLATGHATPHLPRFDTMGGQRELLQTWYHIDLAVGARVAVENLTPAPVSVYAAYSYIFYPRFGVNTINQMQSAVVNVAVSNGVAGSGPDYADLGHLDRYWSDEVRIDFPGPYGFVGTGMLAIPLRLDGSWYPDNPQTHTLTLADFTAHGTVGVTYVYGVIPSPPSALAVLGFIHRRRRRG